MKVTLTNKTGGPIPYINDEFPRLLADGESVYGDGIAMLEGSVVLYNAGYNRRFNYDEKLEFKITN